MLDSCHETSRGMMRGIFEYVRHYGPWRVRLVTGGVQEQKLPDFRFWKGSGIIANSYNRDIADSISAAHLPTVIFDPTEEWQEAWHSSANTCQVRCDSAMIGWMAADYLLQKGFSRFGYIGKVTAINWSKQRQKTFVDKIESAGYECLVYPEPEANLSIWEMERKGMIRWLKKLPKPIALFVAHDTRARQVYDACLGADIHIPYEVAVLSVDNDPLICETSLPSLSSIRMDTEKAGYMAAELLDICMSDKSRGNTYKETRSYPPLQVVSRLSTETINVNDKLVINALEFIRINAGLNIRVSDVANHLRTTPRWLEKKFAHSLQRTVKDEIKRVRMETIIKLITQTSQPFDRIARRCGFSSVNHLRTIFREATGQTMSAFRAGNRD